jgi:two-component system nitrogen regulation sensor histidine kinase NtrY
MNLEKLPVDLREIIEPLVHTFTDQHGSVSFVLDAPTPVIVMGDAALLRRAVENVIRNAVESIDAKGRHGTVAIEIQALPEPAVIVRDDGVGLDDAEAQRLLLPFQSGKPGGFGLGLSLTRKILLLHGGSFLLRGEPGKGATAELQFPAVRLES